MVPVLVIISLLVHFCLTAAVNSKTAHALPDAAVSASQRSKLQKARTRASQAGAVMICCKLGCQAFDAAYGTLSFDHVNYDKYVLVAETCVQSSVLAVLCCVFDSRLVGSTCQILKINALDSRAGSWERSEAPASSASCRNVQQVCETFV